MRVSLDPKWIISTQFGATYYNLILRVCLVIANFEGNKIRRKSERKEKREEK